MPKFISCEICRSTDPKIIQKAEPPYNVVRCSSCGLVYVNPQPDKDFLFSGYASEYYQDWIEKQNAARSKLWENRLKKVRQYKKGGRLLDVGCGEGSFLNQAQKNGFRVIGQEISPDAAALVKKKWGIEIFCGELGQASLEKNSFDVITLWHSLEHTPNPLATLRECSALLKDDGLLIAAVPNLHDYFFRFFYLLGRRKLPHYFSTQDREKHLFYFSSRTLSLILAKAGFQILRIGLDRQMIVFWKSLADYPAVLIERLSKINLGQAIEVFSGKYKKND